MVNFEDLYPEKGFIIGEIACGHEGSEEKLKQLIDCIADGGADAVKFQIFTPRERANPDHPEWEIFNKLALSKKAWEDAASYARKKNLVIFADIFGEESFTLASAIGVDGFKIHSEDLLNSYFILKVAKAGKITMIGVGGAHRIEIYNLLNFLKEQKQNSRVILVTGVQTFPTPIEAHSIEEAGDLVSKYSPLGVKVGFSDHISGDLEEAKMIPLMALAKGAVFIEKHVTVDRGDQWEDYQSALGKDDFKKFVQYVKKLSPTLNRIEKLNSFEVQYRKNFKKVPVAVRNLEKGHLLSPADIEYVKHAESKIPVASLNIIGRKLVRSVEKGEVVRFAGVEQKVGGIIVARCTSNRLPSKATRLIEGRETIALLIERIKRCRTLQCVVLATSTDSSDDILIDIAKREGVLSFRGSLENLSLRFYEAAKHYGVDQIVRITGDDILRDETMIDKAVRSHLENSCDVTFTRNMPYGTSSEIFSLNTLETILNTVVVASHTEYLEWYLQNDRYFSVNYVDSDYTFDPKIRLTLDYEEDVQLFSRIFSHFYKMKPSFTLKEVLAWLKENPDAAGINQHKTPKYTSRDLNVSLNI